MLLDGIGNGYTSKQGQTLINGLQFFVVVGQKSGGDSDVKAGEVNGEWLTVAVYDDATWSIGAKDGKAVFIGLSQ